MKTKCLYLLFVLILLTTKVNAGGIPILYSTGEDIEMVYELPYTDDYEFMAEDGNYYHFNLGVLHEQFSIFYIPLINYGTERYVLFAECENGSYDYTYITLSHDDIEYLQDEFYDIPNNPELPFWDAWGGKLLMLVLIAGAVFVYYIAEN